MPFQYLDPSLSGALRQGEILSDVWEHRPVYPAVELPSGTSIADVESLIYPRVIVMTADCDLLWDYQARSEAREHQQSGSGDRDHQHILPHVLLCELYEENEIRIRVSGSDIWRRIRQNQDERYHHLTAATIGDPQRSELPELYLDFKKILSLPTLRLYEALERSGIGRVAVMPPVYLHNLTHRFYTFLGRVAVPE